MSEAAGGEGRSKRPEKTGRKNGGWWRLTTHECVAYKRANLLKQVERQVRTVMDEMRRAQRWHDVFTAIAWSPMLLFAMAITVSLRVPSLPAAVLGYAAAVMDVLTWGVMFSFPLIPIG